MPANKKTKKPGFKFEADPSLTGTQDSGTVVIEKNKPKKKETDTTSEAAVEMSAFNLDPVPADKQKSLGQLPEKVRNKMGYEMKPGFQMNYKMVNRKGFEMAGSPKKMAAYRFNGEGDTETKKDFSPNIVGDVSINSTGGSEDTYTSRNIDMAAGGDQATDIDKYLKGLYTRFGNEVTSQELIDKKYMSKAHLDAYNKITGNKNVGVLNPGTEPTVNKTFTPDVEKRDIFSNAELRQRNQSLNIVKRGDKRIGLDNLVNQKRNLKDNLKSQFDVLKNTEFESGKQKREAKRSARKEKRNIMRSFRAGNYQGVADKVKDQGIVFDAAAAEASRKQFRGVGPKSQAVKDQEDASLKNKRVGSQINQFVKTDNRSQEVLDKQKRISGNGMKPMQLSPKAINYFNKKKK
jgi:hypothetical protein